MEDMNISAGRSGHIGSSPMHICNKVLSMDSLGMDRDQLQVRFKLYYSWAGRGFDQDCV